MKRFVHEASPMDMLNTFEDKLDDLKSSENIEASIDDSYDYESRWEMLEVKGINDWDGFRTEYSLWKNHNTGEYACFYGDSDIYNPVNGTEPDELFDDDSSAYEWFEYYRGPEDDNF